MNDELSVGDVAHLVNACVRMAASYAEIEKQLGDDTYVGGKVIVGVVQNANDKKGKGKMDTRD
ncbi:hypothetical protein MKW98_004835 [Papaver atlanticum]|uniref:Uncharacterized protein n=1 Tax=Papaver atlanticum TaxID=357466 RepID=A0AAD4XF39_9MAGN|nr:hypothetical protein MKW98_004835 [Papaver atlanticum]